jgi:hypothetical protein
MNLSEEIKSAIKNHLPQQVAGELKNLLGDYENIQEENKQLKRQNESLEAKAKAAREELEKKRSEYYIFQEDREKLEKLRKELEEEAALLGKQQMCLDLDKAKHELATERAARSTIENFVLNLSKSPVYKKTTLQERSHVVPPTPGIVDNAGCVWREPVAGHVEQGIDETTETVETE